MTPLGSISPGTARADDLPQEIIRKRPSFHGAEDLKRASHLAPTPGNLAQEKKLVSHLSEKKSSLPQAPTEVIKKGGVPDFDDEGAIRWVGRMI
jgi:hypothetical protein